MRISALRVVAEQAAEAWVIVHADKVGDLAISVIIPTYPIHAGVGLELAANQMAFYNLTKHYLGDGVGMDRTPLRKIIGIIIAHKSPC